MYLGGVVDTLLKFLSNLNNGGVSPESWYIYCKLIINSMESREDPVKTLREAGELISSIRIGDLTTELNLSAEQVAIYFKKLLDLGWVANKNGYWKLGCLKLGQPILLATPIKKVVIPREDQPQTMEDKIRGLMQQQARKRAVQSVTKLNPQARMQALAHIRKRRNSKSPGVRILTYAQERYLEVFGREYPMQINLQNGGKSFPKEIGMINRFFGYCNNDEQVAKSIISWVFENWDQITKRLGIVGNFQSGILASGKLFKCIKNMYAEAGLASIADTPSVANRFDKAAADNAPDEGF